jgi:hypothetical protein
MKQFLRAIVFAAMVALFLFAWSLPAEASGKITSTKEQVAQAHVGLNAGIQPGFAPSADPRGTGALKAISAVSATDMWAVGSGLGTLTEHWNGTMWSVVKSPNPGSEYNDLNGVAAIASNDVWAVGSYSDNPQVPDTNTLIEHWNGTKWSVVSSLSPGPYSNTLSAVVAISATDVWAVGISSNGGGNLTLTEHWNGTQWSVVSSPSPNSNATLNGAVAVSTSDVWAVGFTFGSGNGFSGGSQQTLIEQWNGSAWNVVSSPSPGSSSNLLNGVAAVSASDVWAVGFQQNSGGVQQTLIEQWNGSSWSVISSPSPSSFSNTLTNVAAVSASGVWAVGSQDNSGYLPQTLIEQWNGSSWSVVSSPNVGSYNNQLWGVVAFSPNLAWTVGFTVEPNGPPQTLVERWNGTKWSVFVSPNKIGAGSLSGVAAISASDIWAVGSDASGALTEHWNGTQWSVATSPNAVSGSFLYGISAASANNVWAVGTYGQTFGIYYTLIEHWNGKTWSIVTSPSPGSVGSMLNGVVDLSGSNAWAVGSSSKNNFSSKTLTEQWNGSAWSVVTSPNVRTLP